MKLILCKSKKLGSKLLRLYMWSKWSHSAILDEETQLVYDTTWTHGGCRVVPASEFFKDYTSYEERDLNIVDIEGARDWLVSQLGKPYDWTALFGIFFRRDWQEDDSWFCSEHTETFISLFERKRFNADASRITPYLQEIII